MQKFMLFVENKAEPAGLCQSEYESTKRRSNRRKESMKYLQFSANIDLHSGEFDFEKKGINHKNWPIFLSLCADLVKKGRRQITAPTTINLNLTHK
ncbi:MAG: hypothetical protein KDC44_01315 [Phaeodactylibacter sp.]|nr:hypothetical protein [Phaeodactylibacter sp.]